MLNNKILKEKNYHYINSGNIFSKLNFLKDIISSKKNGLIIVENSKKQEIYEKIGSYLNFKINKLNNFSDLVEIIYNNNGFYTTAQNFFNLKIDNFKQLEYKNILVLNKNDSISINEITKKLNEFNYIFSDFQNNNSFNIKGDILSITNNLGETYKINFWGDAIEEIIYKNINLDKIYIGKNEILNYENLGKFNEQIEEKINNTNILKIVDSIDFYENYDKLLINLNNSIVFNSLGNNINFIDLGVTELFIDNIEYLKNILSTKGKQINIYTKNINTIKNFIDLNNFENINLFDTDLNILKSFQNNDNIVICDDNLSRIFIKKRIKRSVSKNLDLLMQIKPGDYIVHIEHGIGIFEEIIEKELSGIKKEYITISYKNNDKLFVPITEISRVSKYVGVENPKLTGLSTKEWEKKLQNASKNIEIIAGELLESYAQRKIKKGFSFEKFEQEETKFFNSFDYIYTNDQLNVIKEIFSDMESIIPMDRLLCGDVGFGKTEVAFATIYKAFLNKKQSVLISPLVVLAYEHFEKAKERFKSFGLNIEVLTRFETLSSVKNTLIKLKNGQIDLIIGTHRLLSEDIIYKDLGLMIIDEEHKFGVSDKEKIKKFKSNIDILSMSATPIPRSLNMALNGIKNISMLTTPPFGRQAISTIVTAYNEEIIKNAGEKEFERGGQIFFIHNRVETISAIKEHLRKIFPKKRIIITHGQLPGDTLEKRIIEFKRGQHDILLSTTVIENGIDFSNVNTIFINDSGNFGISQIHQLRGRVGRADKKGYCFLLFKKEKIKEDAIKRLKTIVDYSHLGAGFELAIKDLEIRGSGDILGIKQSGQSSEIGINLFLEMLENKIEELKEKNDLSSGETNKKSLQSCSIDLNIGAFIDSKYFTSELDKINFYREIETLNDIGDLENIINDFTEINQNIPKTTSNFFNLLKIKLLASNYKITSIKKIGINYQIEFSENISLEDLKNFLNLDKEVKFSVVNLTKIRSSDKNFDNEEKFIQYLLQLFENKIGEKKFKLKKKAP